MSLVYKRAGVWNYDFIVLQNDTLLIEFVLSAMKLTGKLRTKDDFKYTVETNLSGETSVYDDPSGEEILAVESNMLGTSYAFRFRDYPDLQVVMKPEFSWWKTVFVVRNQNQEWIRLEYKMKGWTMETSIQTTEIDTHTPFFQLLLGISLYVFTLYNIHSSASVGAT